MALLQNTGHRRRARFIISLIVAAISSEVSAFAPAAPLARPIFSNVASSRGARPLSSTTAFELDYYNPNEIQPKTKTLRRSASFFARYVIRMILENRKRKQYQQLKKRAEKAQGRFGRTWSRRITELNEQRRNLVTLADYSASIVVPSFLFLVLGAFMMSVIPHYEAKCIQLVATMNPSRAKLGEALLGLGISSTLCAFFTGMRGSLFWIAGTRVNYNVRVKLHRNMLLQEAAFFDSNETGYLLSRLNNDVNKIGNVVSYHVNVVFRQLAQFVFGSVYLIKIAPRLSLWAFGGIALVAWLSLVYGHFNRKLR